MPVESRPVRAAHIHVGAGYAREGLSRPAPRRA